jgi:hypothetical protein
MVRAIKRKGGAYSPYAVATARLGPSRLNPLRIRGIYKTKREALGSAKWIRKHEIGVKKRGPSYYVKQMVPNPQRICEYCRLLAHKYSFATSREEKRRILARFKLHKKAMHGAIKNPLSSKTKRRAARIAGKLAYRIWRSVKTKGYAIPVPKRTPKIVKKYLRIALSANGIKWTVR